MKIENINGKYVLAIAECSLEIIIDATINFAM